MSNYRETQPIRTDDADWSWKPDDLNDYLSGNYERLAPEDRYIGAIAISAIASHARTHNLFGTLPFGTLICAGAVPRGGAVLAPLIRPREQGGYLDVSDREQSNVDSTKQALSQLALGELGLWTPHQEDYTAINPLWSGSFQEAGILAEDHVHTEDMRELEPGAHYAIAVEHGPESATTVETEYREFIHAICDALVPGGILYMAYMLGSEGYEVGGVMKPAIPVSAGYVGNLLHSSGMDILVNASVDPSHSIRVEGDSHTYDGMGVAVAIHR